MNQTEKYFGLILAQSLNSTKGKTMPRQPKKPLTEKEKATRAQLKVDNFKKIAGKRMSAIISKIELLAKCSNRGGYTYDAEQIDKMEKALSNTVETTVAAFRAGLNRTSKAADDKPGFEF